MRIVQAELHHLDLLVSLFDDYRVFYAQKSDLLGARNFIEERLKNKDSTIFLVLDGSEAVSFSQLYPSFTSIGMRKILILNDLYVLPQYRRQGIARMLLDNVKQFAQENDIAKITLQTAHDNIEAQKLYESFEYEKDLSFFHYFTRVEDLCLLTIIKYSHKRVSIL